MTVWSHYHVLDNAIPQTSTRQGQTTQNDTTSAYLEGSDVALKGRHRRKTTNQGKT